MSRFNKINKPRLAIVILLLSLWAWTAFSLTSDRVIVGVETIPPGSPQVLWEEPGQPRKTLLVLPPENPLVKITPLPPQVLWEEPGEPSKTVFALPPGFVAENPLVKITPLPLEKSRVVVRGLRPAEIKMWGEVRILLRENAKKIWLTDWPLFWWLMLPVAPLAGLGWLVTQARKN